MKVADLIGKELDFWIAQIEQAQVTQDRSLPQGSPGGDGCEEEWAPSRNWAQGGPILERQRIVIGPWRGRGWAATVESFPESAAEVGAFGATYLEAGMRCYVAAVFGDEVPDIRELHESVN